MSTPDQEKRLLDIRRKAEELAAEAQSAGVDLTIELRSLPPLGMGNHAPFVDVRPARRQYKQAPIVGEK